VKVFYPTHEFFLSGRAIFLVVFSMIIEDRSRVLYWLKKIKNLTKPEMPVIILVGTREDELEKLPADKQDSILRYDKRDSIGVLCWRPCLPCRSR
jgi:hypothetical protein